MKQRFFKCLHCGNIIAFVEDKGVPVMCCGEKMTELVPNTTEAAGESMFRCMLSRGIKSASRSVRWNIR